MIKVSDLESFQPAPSPALADIEDYIDKKIRLHATARKPWPIVVPTTRSGWASSDVEAVLVRYRAEGWAAMVGGRTALCVLQPDRAATANQRDERLAQALAEHSADIVGDDVLIEPPPGYEDRAVARAKREGVLPRTAGDGGEILYVVQRFCPPSVAEVVQNGMRGQWDTIGMPVDLASATAECLRLRRAERGECSYRVAQHAKREGVLPR